MVVYAGVRHWVAVAVERAGRQEGHIREGQHQSALFYVDKSMVDSSDPGCLQGYFDTLVGLFDWVGLQTNFNKTVRMVYRPCQASGTHSEAACKRQMAGEGISYRERQRVRAKCLEFWGEMTMGLLEVDQQT